MVEAVPVARMAAGNGMTEMASLSAIGRPTRADEIASVIAFLCSGSASAMTGTDVLVDGGAVAAVTAPT